MADLAPLAQLAVTFRWMQLTAHNAHNVTSGETFYQDHSEFGSLYSKYEDIYDGLIERMIGLGSTPNLVRIQQMAVQRLSLLEEPEEMFTALDSGEEEVRSTIENAIKDGDLSQGTINMLAGIADDSEVRSYKFSQRLKG